jgi:hypothetical protein
MPPEIMRAGLRLGVLVLLLAVATLPFLQPNSAEFWASAAAAGVALLFIGGLVCLRSLTRQFPPGKG